MNPPSCLASPAASNDLCHCIMLALNAASLLVPLTAESGLKCGLANMIRSKHPLASQEGDHSGSPGRMRPGTRFLYSMYGRPSFLSRLSSSIMVSSHRPAPTTRERERCQSPSGTSLPTPGTRIDPHTPVFHRNGILWFTNKQTNFIGRLDPRTGNMDLKRVPTPHAIPYGIVITKSDNPVFCEFGTNKIGTI